jgi:hypothetical protein
LSSDNGFYDEINRAVGLDSPWARWRAVAFGLDDGHGRPPTLRQQVIAGLRLYVATVELMAGAFSPEHAALIMPTVELIRHELEPIHYGQ